MERTKANLRAMREIVGYSQQNLADLCGVRVEAVKHWEREDSPREIPDDVWEIVSKAYDAHLEAVATSIEIIDKLCEENPYIGVITLPYWRNQVQYNELGRDPGGLFNVVNARTRAVAAILEDLNIHYEFIAPEDRGLEAIVPNEESRK